MARPNEEKAAAWRQTMADCEASGMKAAAFCRSRGISIHQYRYWRKRLDKRSQATVADGGFIRIDDEESTAAGVTLLAGSYRIAVAAGFCEATLLRTLAALEAKARRR